MFVDPLKKLTGEDPVRWAARTGQTELLGQMLSIGALICTECIT